MNAAEHIPPRRKLTYEDYCALPDDGKRYQIIDGELFVSPSPVTKHQRASMFLSSQLYMYARRTGCGVVLAAPMDVVLSRHDIVEPDILFIATAHVGIIGEKYIDGPPDLVVEILSPSTRGLDRIKKLRLYARAGIRHYWFVDPDANTLEDYVLEGDTYRVRHVSGPGEIFSSPLFPELEIPIDDLFS